MRILILVAILLGCASVANAAPIRDDRYFVAWGGMGQDVVRAVRCAPPRACRQGRPLRGKKRSHTHRTVIADKSLARGFVSEVNTGLAAIAKQYLGSNPTGWRRAWCGNFMRLVVRQAGLPDHKGGNLARNWRTYGSPSGPSPGAIGVMRHHVGIVIGRCRGGRIALRSGNHGRRVADGCYAASRFIAFRRV